MTESDIVESVLISEGYIEKGEEEQVIYLTLM